MVRLGAMGDILHALPAVTALRQAHPEWVIDWVVEPHWHALLAAENNTGRVPPSPSSTAFISPPPESGATPPEPQTLHEIKALRVP